MNETMQAAIKNRVYSTDVQELVGQAMMSSGANITRAAKLLGVKASDLRIYLTGLAQLAKARINQV